MSPSFGAVLNLTLLREAPDAVNMVDRLLDPALREGLPTAELTRLTEVVALGLHNQYLLAGVLSVVALGFALLVPARLNPEGRRVIDQSGQRPEPLNLAPAGLILQ